MITRKRIKDSEKPLMLMWQRLLGKELTTEEGERLKVIYPGRINGDSGPDFRDVIIIMNGSNLVKGDVEIHVKSGDWYSHGHDHDPEYNRVILHVVAQHDGSSATLMQNGQSIPVLCLSHNFSSRAYHRLPCFQIRERRDEQTLRGLLDIAGEERFRQKAKFFQLELQQGETKQALWKSWLRALGYSKNMKPFEELACRVPLSFLERMESRGGLLLKQAWLLGIAGLLLCQRTKGDFSREKEARELEQIWHAMSEGTKTMSENDWHLSHIYPNNSPVRRIIAQSYLLQRYHRDGLLQGMLQLVKEAPVIVGHRWLEDGLIVFGEGYWQDHHDFGLKTKKSALLGRGKAAEIVVNVILPFAFAWGEVANEPELKERAINFYTCHPKLAENVVTHHMARQLCLEDNPHFTAHRQQGLIHIFRNYCCEGGCSKCPLVS